MSNEQQVRISPEFFRKIKLDYADWRWALVREFLQNCFDAPGCRSVELSVVTDGATTALTVVNDGRSMDRDTLVNKLLTLGGSGKNFQGENTGGFGVAKSLLYYCHAGYVISTGDMLVRGCGAQYTITDQLPVLGTCSVITMEGDEEEAITDAARKFASMAQWRGTLVVNGEVLATDLHKGARRKDLGWGVVYTNKSAENTCIVRLNGQPMFTMPTRYKGCVVVELTGKACATLTSNRDGLVRPYAGQLSDLLTALAIDKRSALREERAEYKRYAGEVQRNEAKKPKAAEDGLASVVDIGQIAALVRGSQVVGGEAAPADGGIKMVVVSKEDAPKTISVGPQFILKNSTGMKVPARFTPGESFCASAKSIVRAWTAVLLKLHQLCNRGGEFSVGFCFDDESEAEYERGVYGSVYYINPIRVVVDGKRRTESRFESAWRDRFQLIGLACHEFVHGAYGLMEHDEDYASRLTEVQVVAMTHADELVDLCRPIAEVKTASNPFAKRGEVLGHSATTIVRWMGSRGWSYNEARDVMSSLEVDLTEGTVRTQLNEGKTHNKGLAIPELTEEQVESLNRLR